MWHVVIRRLTVSASVYCEFSVDLITSRALFKEFFKGVLILESDTDLDSRWCKTPPHTITIKRDFYFVFICVFIYQCFFLKDSSAVKCPKALALLRPMLLQMYPKKPKKTSSQCVPERHTPCCNKRLLPPPAEYKQTLVAFCLFLSSSSSSSLTLNCFSFSFSTTFVDLCMNVLHVFSNVVFD